ncbi:MAG: GAF domain-containing protein [Acidimicrobiia bacterium]|nr:GAF domain-containing protein [Acidimicrobiia bacterium]
MAMTTGSNMIDYRIRVINIGLIVSWLAVAIFIVWALVHETADTTTALFIGGGLVGALILLTLAPWRSALESSIADMMIVAWSFAALIAQLVFEVTEDHRPYGVGFLLVPFFAAATALSIGYLVVVEVASILAYWFALGQSGGYTSLSTTLSVLAFSAASVFVLLISVRVRTQFEETSTRYDELVEREAELSDQEHELSQLYEVSLAIGAGTKLAEVLPELIGRVAAAVGARIGLILQYDGDRDVLDLMSPIWVLGHRIHADEFTLALAETSIAQRVFVTGEPTLFNDIRNGRVDALMTELDAERIAGVALRVEDRAIGVLIVADKPDEFTDDDLGTLEMLAAPASLVLNQITRYEAARESSERMTELAEMKTEFVSVVSHELRTPLTSIIGALKTLQRPELRPDDERANQLIDMAAKQSNRLRSLIEDLLVMSRLEATSLPVRPVSIHLGSFLGDVLDSIDTPEPVAYEIDPPAEVVLADPDHLARVVTNLVENALKYGGDTPVTIDAVRVGDAVRMSVIDHGPGIPYEKHNLIFQRFTQLQPNATRSKGGAGLGLSIVQGLVEAMNGRVWFEPTPGGGATFTVSLPVPTDEP